MKYSVKRTLQLCLLAELVCVFLSPADMRLSLMVGVLWGAAAALGSLYMICRQTDALTPSVKGETRRGVGGYMIRYLFYALCLGLGAWLHVSILTMAVGILLQKISLVLYAVQNRKDSE